MESTIPDPTKKSNPNVQSQPRAEIHKASDLRELKNLPVSILSVELFINGERQTFQRHINPNLSLGGFVGEYAKVGPNAYISPEAVVADKSVISGSAKLIGNVITRDSTWVDGNAKVVGTSKSRPLVLRDTIHVTGEAVLNGSGEIRGSQEIRTQQTIFK